MTAFIINFTGQFFRLLRTVIGLRSINNITTNQSLTTGIESLRQKVARPGPPWSKKAVSGAPATSLLQASVVGDISHSEGNEAGVWDIRG